MCTHTHTHTLTNIYQVRGFFPATFKAKKRRNMIQARIHTHTHTTGGALTYTHPHKHISGAQVLLGNIRSQETQKLDPRTHIHTYIHTYAHTLANTHIHTNI